MAKHAHTTNMEGGGTPPYHRRLAAYVENGDSLPLRLVLPLIGAGIAFLAILALAVIP